MAYHLGRDAASAERRLLAGGRKDAVTGGKEATDPRNPG